MCALAQVQVHVLLVAVLDEKLGVAACTCMHMRARALACIGVACLLCPTACATILDVRLHSALPVLHLSVIIHRAKPSLQSAALSWWC